MKKIILLFVLFCALSSFCLLYFSKKETIAIIGAMDVEISSISNNLKDGKISKSQNFEVREGNWGKYRVIVTKSGVGKVNAASTTQYVIDKYNPKFIVNTGIAGGLNEALTSKSTLIAEKTVQYDYEETAFGHPKGCMDTQNDPNNPTYYYSDKNLVEKFEDRLSQKSDNVLIGTIATGDTFVVNPEMKEQIKSEFRADAIDMESSAIAQTAKKNNVPFVIIKTISDSKDGSTDEYTKNKTLSAEECATNVLYVLAEK